VRHVLFLILVLLLLGCSPETPGTDPLRGHSDTVRIGNNDPVCRECEVEFHEVTLLGDPTGPASVSEDAAGRDCSVGRLSTGEYVVSSIVGGGEIFVYGPDGQVVRTFGRSGEGPGELGTSVSLLVGPADTLYITDETMARLSVFTATGAFVRSFPILNQVWGSALLNNGNLLFSRRAAGIEDSLLFLTAQDGEELGRFGTVAFDPFDMDRRVVAPAQPEGFWTASIWQHELRRWSALQSLELTVTRDVDWFPPDGEYIDGMPFTIPAPPTLRHIWDDGQGRLWIYFVVADSAWEPEIPLDPRHEWGRRTFDTVIEVIDLNDGKVIVSKRHDHLLGMVCGTPLVYMVVEAEDGDTRLRVMKPTLIGPSE